jgi:beta-N-acetylglucosaminidase
MGVITNHVLNYNIDSSGTNYQIMEKTLEMKPLMVSTRNISYNDINHHTDLSVMNKVTVDDINRIITYWDSACGGSPFLNEGQIFIDASIESGLDPVYILAHAGLESAWGNSYFGTMYHNYFGIGAFDYDPDNAINYSNDNMREGIIEGAKWIKENYYNTGQTSLYSMRYNNGYNEYCTSDTWVNSITSIIQTSYSLISS